MVGGDDPMTRAMELIRQGNQRAYAAKVVEGTRNVVRWRRGVEARLEARARDSFNVAKKRGFIPLKRERRQKKILMI